MNSGKPFIDNDKYCSTGETTVWLGITLHRIRAKVAIGIIAAGTLGGWVEKEANLDIYGNAWVSGNAQVSGDAQVSGNAQVSGDARVYGDAQVYGDAWVYGDAQVYDNARVYDNAQVSGNAQVYGDAWVYGDAQVYDNARVYDNAQVSGNAQVYGNAWVSGNARVSGDAQVYGDAWVYGDAQVYGNARVYGNAWVYGVICLATRSDGHNFVVAPTPDGPRIIAGCRYFTFEQARKHWTETRGGTQLGDESLALVDFLERMAAIRGFMEPVAAPAEGRS